MKGAAAFALGVLALVNAQAGTLEDLNVAKAKWAALGAQSYSFEYILGGAVVVAPACADATILVRVKNGEPAEPIVTKGSRRCPVGTRGSDAIGFEVPSTVDDAFAEMARYIESPPVRAEVTAKFDGVTGVPRIYYVRKLDIDDNDEGFEIVNFRVAK